MLGDGSFAHTKNRDHILQLRVKNKEFTEKFNKIGCSILNKKLYSISEYNSKHYGIFYIVRLNSKKLYEFLRKAKFENLQIIMKLVDEYPIDFLEGLYDSDGCVSYYWSGRRLYKAINLSNSSLDLLEIVKKLLLKFDIKSKIYSRNAKKNKKRLAKDGHFIISKKPIYALEIKRKSEIIKFSKIVKFTIKHRAEKLKKLVKELEKISGIDPLTNKRKITEYHKQRISKANKGRKRLDMIGDLNPAKRPEARIKISKAKKEYWRKYREGLNA